MKPLSQQLLIVGLVLIIASCGSQRYQTTANLPQVKIKLTAPAETATKRVLKVEVFNTATCYFDQTLNNQHVNYQGHLLYQENIDNTEIVATRWINADQAITFKSSLSKVFDQQKSDICYFQPTTFYPKANKSYEVFFSPYCEILIFEIDQQKPSVLKPLDLSANFECLDD